MAILFVLLALAVLAVLAGANWYLWRRLFRDTTRASGWVRRGGAVLLAGGWVLAIAALVAERSGAPFWLQKVLAWPGFLWLALSIYLLLAVVAGELVRPLLRRWLEHRDRRSAAPAGSTETAGGTGEAGSTVPADAPVTADAAAETAAPRPHPVPAGGGTPAAGGADEAVGAPEAPERSDRPAAPSRRLFVSRVIGGAAAVAAVGTVGYGTYGVLNGPTVKRVTVPLAKLPRAAHGYRIAVVSDIHLSPVLGRGFAQKVVDTINGTQPDLIAVVGDLVDGSVKDLGPAAAPLAGLEARDGAYFVTGNHEYFSGAEQWVEEVRRLGLLPLENARTELPWFDVAGVNDIAGEDDGQGPDFAKALGDRDTARACVLLAHQPVQIHDAVEHGVDLQLSGHTHGGQLWPGNFIAAGANPTVAGLERYGDTQLYVSRGAGAWGPPTRVGAESDITVIRLASRQA
ncbi:metallophosphoesterase [Streptomyces sp. NPDC091281]|uniref:metallophosphoesterase n=1 Tax=Streptomyces sp. NPDC091281 TaxID=3365985 RepID=UPI00381F33EE